MTPGEKLMRRRIESAWESTVRRNGNTFLVRTNVHVGDTFFDYILGRRSEGNELYYDYEIFVYRDYTKTSFEMEILFTVEIGPFKT